MANEIAYLEALRKEYREVSAKIWALKGNATTLLSRRHTYDETEKREIEEIKKKCEAFEKS